jgi:hypothetical protein
MSLEWSVAGLLLAAALWPLVRKTRSWGVRVGTIFLFLAVVLGGLVWKSRAHTRLTAQNQLLPKLPVENRPGGFVRSDTCRSCHPTQHESWHRSFHRSTTQRATPEAVRGNFTNVTLTLNNEMYACEACHGPGEKHVRANSVPLRRYARRHSRDGDSTIVNPARLTSQKSSEVCGQCHAAQSSRSQGKWLAEGTEYWPRKQIDTNCALLPGQDLQQIGSTAGERQAAQFSSLVGYFWRDGMVRVSGREYNGLAETPCFQRGHMSCLSCHSMHKMTDADVQLTPGTESNQACYQCHKEYSATLAQHTHHAPNSPGSLCYNCHMPHTTYGLLKATRSHQITSPGVRSSIDTGRPNACNLCHLDQTLAWTAKTLHEWYRQPVAALEADFANTSASAVWLLRGDAGQRALIAWHMGWSPAKQASGTNWLVPYLAETLDDPYAAVRYIGQRSLKCLPGYEHLAYDYIAPAEQRVHAKSEILQRWNPGALSARDSAKALLPREMSRLLQRRDQRRMELLE